MSIDRSSARWILSPWILGLASLLCVIITIGVLIGLPLLHRSQLIGWVRNAGKNVNLAMPASVPKWAQPHWPECAHRFDQINLGSAQVFDADMRRLACAPECTALFLNGTSVTGRGLHCLPNLQKLTLFQTPTDDNGLRDVGQLKVLQELSVGYTSITDAGLLHLSGLTELRSLDLSRNAIDGTGLAALRSCAHLHALSLDHTGLRDESLTALKALTGLQTLQLNSTEISDAGLQAFDDRWAFRELRELDLRDTRATDSGLAFLTRPPKLRSLSLSGKKITDRGLMQLAQSGSLTHIRLVDTRVSKLGILEFHEIKPHCSVSLIETRKSWRRGRL